ncbi:MAG: DUF1540 domain-containing protein [Clostridium butyricum]|nr:DUF1540 domain-containing protein [Clostridium butyricum]
MDINSNIKCSVESCKYHADAKDYCTLNAIKVGTHEQHPKESKCTDCQSFEVK